MDKLHLMAEALIKYETIDTDQIKDIMTGKAPREPRDWSGGTTPPSQSNEVTGENTTKSPPESTVSSATGSAH